MSTLKLFLSGLLIFSFAGLGSAAAAVDPSPVGNATQTTDAQEYLANIDRVVSKALSGEYGKLKRGSDAKLKGARDRIASLLNGHPTTTELQPEDRVALVSAEEEIKATILNDDKNRVVCTYRADIGSRFSKKECMTVAEREERAKLAHEATDNAMRGVCVPSETSSCTKGTP
ncbi:MAG: hypothetical protein WC213_09535 [Arenimonas sp.]|jgi:hypothetical protein